MEHLNLLVVLAFITFHNKDIMMIKPIIFINLFTTSTSIYLCTIMILARGALTYFWYLEGGWLFKASST